MGGLNWQAETSKKKKKKMPISPTLTSQMSEREVSFTVWLEVEFLLGTYKKCILICNFSDRQRVPMNTTGSVNGKLVNFHLCKGCKTNWFSKVHVKKRADKCSATGCLSSSS